jgi:hypothetical protein
VRQCQQMHRNMKRFRCLVTYHACRAGHANAHFAVMGGVQAGIQHRLKYHFPFLQLQRRTRAIQPLELYSMRSAALHMHQVFIVSGGLCNTSCCIGKPCHEKLGTATSFSSSHTKRTKQFSNTQFYAREHPTRRLIC